MPAPDTVETASWIRGGLPVRCKGRVIPAEAPGLYDGAVPMCPGHEAYVEDLEVFFKSGSPFTGEITDADRERLEQDLILRYEVPF